MYILNRFNFIRLDKTTKFYKSRITLKHVCKYVTICKRFEFYSNNFRVHQHRHKTVSLDPEIHDRPCRKILHLNKTFHHVHRTRFKMLHASTAARTTSNTPRVLVKQKTRIRVNLHPLCQNVYFASSPYSKRKNKFVSFCQKSWTNKNPKQKDIYLKNIDHHISKKY